MVFRFSSLVGESNECAECNDSADYLCSLIYRCLVVWFVCRSSTTIWTCSTMRWTWTSRGSSTTRSSLSFSTRDGQSLSIFATLTDFCQGYLSRSRVGHLKISRNVWSDSHVYFTLLYYLLSNFSYNFTTNTS